VGDHLASGALAGERVRLRQFGDFMRQAPGGHRLLHGLATSAYGDANDDEGRMWRRLMEAARPKPDSKSTRS
jgi:hypothetical protein